MKQWQVIQSINQSINQSIDRLVQWTNVGLTCLPSWVVPWSRSSNRRRWWACPTSPYSPVRRWCGSCGWPPVRQPSASPDMAPPLSLSLRCAASAHSQSSPHGIVPLFTFLQNCQFQHTYSWVLWVRVILRHFDKLVRRFWFSMENCTRLINSFARTRTMIIFSSLSVHMKVGTCTFDNAAVSIAGHLVIDPFAEAALWNGRFDVAGVSGDSLNYDTDINGILFAPLTVDSRWPTQLHRSPSPLPEIRPPDRSPTRPESSVIKKMTTELLSFGR